MTLDNQPTKASRKIANLPNWVSWKLETINGKTTKPPYIVGSNQHASATDPSTWRTYDVAKASVPLNGKQGIGFAFGDSGYAAIDMDGSLNPETGKMTPWGDEFLEALPEDVYVEISPSGCGVKVFVEGELPPDCDRVLHLDPSIGYGDKVQIEFLGKGRYSTVTENSLYEDLGDVVPCDLAAVYRRADALRKKYPAAANSNNVKGSTANSVTSSASQRQATGTVITSDYVLLKNGTLVGNKPCTISDAFGNSKTYPGRSEADLGFCTYSAIEHRGKSNLEDLIWEDYKTSAVVQTKWLKREVDFRRGTIAKAIKSAADIRNATVIEAATVSDNDEEEIVDVETKLPEFPKFTGSLNNLCEAMSPDIPYAFLFASAISHMGLIRSGLDFLRSEPHVQPRFYTALVSPPGRGKTASLNEIAKVMRSVSSGYRVLSTMDSGPALCDSFNKLTHANLIKNAGVEEGGGDNAARILISSDELSGLFERSKVTASSKNTLQHSFLELYESNKTGNHVRGLKLDIEIECAHLGLLGGATESGYASMWLGTSGGRSGMQSRIIPVGIEGAKVPAVQRPPDIARVTAITQELIEQARQPAFGFSFDPKALGSFTEWWNAKDQENNPAVDRIDGIAKRLLLVLARTNQVEIIGPDLANQAMAFCDFVISCREKFNPQDATTFAQAYENLIIDLYKKCGPMTANACRHKIKPERRNLGGAGPYIQGFKNLVAAGMLREVGKTHKSAIYALHL